MERQVEESSAEKESFNHTSRSLWWDEEDVFKYAYHQSPNTGSDYEQDQHRYRAQTNVDHILPRVPKAIMDAGLVPGEDAVIDLSMAENWLIRDEILTLEKTVAKDALAAEHLSFPKGFWGHWDAITSIASFLNSYFNPHVPVSKHHIALAPGASGCLDALMYNICDPGDGVLIPAPYWNGYDGQCRLRAEVAPIPVVTPDLEDISSFLSSLDAALASADRPVRALVLTNPHNPLGRCFSLAQLSACLQWCEKHDLHLVSDEVFGPLNFETPDLPSTEKFVSVLALDCERLGCDPARLHMVWSPSKVLAVTGVRLGCTVTQANKQMLDAHALASFSYVSVLSAKLVASLLSSPSLSALMRTNSERFAASYATMTAWLRKMAIPYLPCNASPFLMAHVVPDAKTWEEEAAVVNRLQEEAKVWVSAGRSQHMPDTAKGWVRLTFALDSVVIEEACRRMEPILKRESRQLDALQT